MIIERFKPGKVRDVYDRFEKLGRLMPEGLQYVSSWITSDLSTCYQVMETNAFENLQQWMDNWKDLIDFEVIPVITSQEAKEKISP